MKPNHTAALFLALLLSTPALAALGPASPPPGITQEAWGALVRRADKATAAARKLVRGANEDCLRAVFVKLLGELEAGASGEDGLPVTVEASKKKQFQRALEKNRDENCSGGDGGATVEAMARFTADAPEWDISERYARAVQHELNEARRYLFERAAPRLTPKSPSVLELLRLGVLVPAAEGATAAAGALMPVVNPELFMPRPRDDA